MFVFKVRKKICIFGKRCLREQISGGPNVISLRTIMFCRCKIKKTKRFHRTGSCLVWVCNLVADIEGGKEAKAV